jgi:hypothetical protein
MNEVQRQAYLKAMGIQSYFPRISLAGAKASPQYQLDSATELATPEAAVSELASPAASSSGSTREPRQPLHKTSKESGSEVGNKEYSSNKRQQISDKNVEESSRGSDQEAAAETDSPAELKFELCYYPISNKLAVIDEVPHHWGGESQAHSVALLQAILRALEVNSSHCEFLPETFSWPFAAQLDMKIKPALAARKALLGFIKKRHEINRFENLLIFAGQLDELLTVNEDGKEQRDFQFFDSDITSNSSSNYRITITTSLQSMLAYPLLKRDAWKQLQSLRQRLSH